MNNLIPENAPFSPQERAWLDGFLSGALGLPQNNGASSHMSTHAAPALPAAAPVVAATATAAAPVATQAESQAESVEEVRKRLAEYDRVHPFPATVLEVQPLTRKDSEKDVRAVALDLRGSGLSYEVGDALGVYPENCPELVQEILAALDATGEEPVVTPESTVVPARVALARAYVINECGDDFLHHLSHAAADPNEASRLAALAEDDTEDFLKGRDVLDVLHHFPSTLPQNREAIGELVASLSPLRPRLYSIASSLKAHPDQVHLTVGVVRYGRDGCDRVRKGVASTFLTERMQPGTKVGVFVQRAHGFRPPLDGDVPMIMVGPGTGIAPFRAFLQERAATGASGPNWLFFGDQRRDSDFLYRGELESYVESGVLTRLDTAFSRDQETKIYVQNRMTEHSETLWQWLQDGAHFYVCGDARRMASDVDKALHAIVAQHGQMSDKEAKTFVANLAKSGRYQRDVY